MDLSSHPKCADCRRHSLSGGTGAANCGGAECGVIRTLSGKVSPLSCADRPTATRHFVLADGVPARSGDTWDPILRATPALMEAGNDARHAPILDSPGPAWMVAAPIAECVPVSPPRYPPLLGKRSSAFGWNGYDAYRYNTAKLRFHASSVYTVNTGAVEIRFKTECSRMAAVHASRLRLDKFESHVVRSGHEGDA